MVTLPPANASRAASATSASTRVQTGVRIDKTLLKVLKALAAEKEMSLGDLLEGIVLHAFENKTPFGDDTLALIATFRQAYGLTLTAADSHKLEKELDAQ